VLNNLAGLLMVKALGDRASDPASDRMAAAEAMFRKVVVIRKRSWGPQSHDVAIALNNLALTLLEQGKLARARDAFEESLAIQERHPEMTRRTRITTRYNLATLAGELGKHEEAARLAAELVPDAEAAYGAGHSMLAEIRQFHGVCLVKLGRFAAAEEQFLAAHAIAAAALGEHARLTVILIEKTRNFYRFRVRRGDAGKQAALEIWQARLQAARAGAAGR
jgi:tetratricopeptide (TPR) repeat protein